ncbi:FAD-dependent thymidylate synthase [Magnetofaba australis]|uniref:FAD-dependent thymidylate synthase n=1 Tax=Magnetofaba australis IT-1 TaxID=1434232 RepID=A0A1Y2K019_9PROT|nr:FAD-dependent thymidylate synthase [Magnetofaba australis]OSM00134.1 putative thymidylate synthase, flavin-dependent [Magnetofaba australis IT-1]
MEEPPYAPAFQTGPTQELEAEIQLRLQLHPDTTRRIGNFGFIELESAWGDEATIINTARISTTNMRIDSPDDFTDRDRALLYHLLKNNHGTPFESVYFRFRMVAPIFVLRQWMRHRICSFNEFSQRYRMPVTAFFVPDREARTVDGFEVMTDEQIQRYTELMESLHRFYHDCYDETKARIAQAEEAGEIPRITGGRNPYRARARELLRNAMSVSTYSDVYWTINFRSLMNFFDLRRKPNAQYEIRQYADAAYGMFEQRFPILSETMNRVLSERRGDGEGGDPIG